MNVIASPTKSGRGNFNEAREYDTDYPALSFWSPDEIGAKNLREVGFILKGISLKGTESAPP